MKEIFNIFRINQYPDRYLFWLSLVISIFTPLLGDIIAPIYYSQYIKGMSADLSFELLYQVILSYVAILVTKTIIWRIGNFLLIITEKNSMERLSNYTVKHLLYLSMDFYKNNFVGSLIGKHNKFTRAYERIYDIVFFDLIPTVIIFICILPIMLFKMPLIGIGIMIIGFIFAFTTIKFVDWIQPYNNDLAEIDSKVTGIISDQLGNIGTIQSFGKTEEEVNRYEYYNRERTKKRKDAWYRGYVQWSFNDLFQLVFSIGMIFITLQLWNTQQFQINDVVLIMSYSIILGSRIANIGNIVKNIKQAQADAEEMVAILKAKPSVVDKPHSTVQIPSNNKQIHFDNITFSYDGETNVFEKFNLIIKPGEKVGIVGASGSGKSTLIKLLLREVDINDGNIAIGGVDIRDVPLRNLRHQISLVPQEPLLFHRTIRHNIAYGRPDASFEEVNEAARKAQAHEFILDTTDGYNTKVGERGIKLSGGQRQRIAIARALLAKRPILIMDEATSSLDSIAEIDIQNAINSVLHEDGSMICIAHRLSTVTAMDRIIVMDQGKIIEEGTHQELINLNGKYKALVDAQELWKKDRWFSRGLFVLLENYFNT